MSQPEAEIEQHEPRQAAGNSKQTQQVTEWSPRFKARVAGVFQLLGGFLFGQVGIFNSLIVPGNAMSSTGTILANETLYRVGFVSCVMGVVFHLVLAFLFDELFKPVNRRVSSLAMYVMLVACAVQAVASLLYLAPVVILKGGGALSALTAEQLQAQAYIFLKLNVLAYDLFLVFFGFWIILIGYLILNSTFLPRILGVLLMIDGVGWTIFMSPPLATTLFPFIVAAAGLSELPLLLWLLIKGVNPERWNEQANAAKLA